MLRNESESEKLFSKFVSVTLKDSATNHCRINKLHVTVEWQSSSIAVQRQELVVTLTDDNDPFFLYSLNLCEEDFQVLKVAQGLLVDFSSFPQKFIDLLELCIQEEQKPQPKFLFVLNTEDRFSSISRTSQIDIIETNPFKHLTHLSLKLVAATEANAKHYLSACFKNLKDRMHQQDKRIEFLEKELQNTILTKDEILSRTIQEFETVRKELTAELSITKSKSLRTLEEETEKLIIKHKQEINQLEKEKREVEQSLRKNNQQLEARVSCLDVLNKEIQDKNYSSDRTIRALEKEQRAMEAESQKMKERCHEHCQQMEDLKIEIRERKAQISQHKETNHDLQVEISEKNELIKRLQWNLESHLEEKKALGKNLEEKTGCIEAHEKSTKSLTEQLDKSNCIIDRLMAEVKTCQEKIKFNLMVNVKLEETLNEKEKMIHSLNSKISSFKEQQAAKDIELRKSSCKIASLNESAKNFETELKARENVIKWLNRQMTDACLVPQYTPPDNLTKQLTNITESSKDNRKMSPSALNSNSSPALPASSSRIPRQKQTNESNANSRNVSTPKLPKPGSNVKFTDSAYSTSPSTLVGNTVTDLTSPSLFEGTTTNIDLADIDPSVLSAAFGSGENQIPLWKPNNNPFGEAGRSRLKHK